MKDWPKDMKLAIAQPLTWPYIHSWTHMSMFSLDRPDIILLDTPRGGDIAEKREKQAEAVLSHGCTHVAFLDADMVYPKKTLWDMAEVLENGADLCGIVCYRGYPPHDPLIWGEADDELLTPFKDYNFGDLVNASAVGCGCLMLKSHVLLGLERPWFQICEIREGERIIRRGEDTYFTRKATSAGFSLKVITSYDIGHIREMVIDRNVWLMNLIISKLGTTERIIELLKRLEKEEENG